MDAVLNAKLQRARASCTERMARKLRDALPGGDDPPRAALWEFLRPLLSPAPAANPWRLWMSENTLPGHDQNSRGRIPAGNRGGCRARSRDVSAVGLTTKEEVDNRSR